MVIRKVAPLKIVLVVVLSSMLALAAIANERADDTDARASERPLRRGSPATGWAASAWPDSADPAGEFRWRLHA